MKPAARASATPTREERSRRRPARVSGLAAPETEALLRSTLDALSAHIAVLDGTGRIVAVNRAWRSFADESGFVGEDHGVGSNYLAVCESGAQVSPDAAETANALRDIMAGRRRSFRMEYPCTGPDGPRWFQLRMTRPEHGDSERIVVAHEDVTEVKRAHEQLSRLAGRVMQLQDEERRSIARELHDTTAQNLLAVTLNVSRMWERLKSGTPPSDGILSDTLDLAERSLQEVRTLSYLLHPPLLDVVGLGSALKWLGSGFAERSKINVEVTVESDLDDIPQDAATALFRVAQECLANVHRHSGSPWARVALARCDGTARLVVSDGGCGLRNLPKTESREGAHNLGVGLSSMHVRLEQLQGRLVIDSHGSGTRVTAIIPLPR